MIDGRTIWDREYETLQVIPSSLRTLPSKVLVMLISLIDLPSNTRVLDAGCGIGRNSLFLAEKGCQLYCIDYSKVALERLQDNASLSAVEDRVHVFYQSLLDDLPFADSFFDVVIDSYVFCHFLNDNDKNRYWDNIGSVVRKDGIVFLSLFASDDEYYAQFSGNDCRSNRIVMDTNNTIPKFIYDEQDVRNLLESSFEEVYFTKFQFDDIVLGRTYKRSVLAFLMRKR